MAKAYILVHFLCVFQTFANGDSLSEILNINAGHLRVSRQIDDERCFMLHKRKSKHITTKGCILPDYPKNGRWEVFQTDTQIEYKPGQSLENYGFLNIKCGENHKLSGDSIVACLNGKWTKNIGTCEVLCPPLLSTSTMDVMCVFLSEETVNCTQAVTGTMAKIKCKSFYEDVQFERQPYMFCINGQWNKPVPNCVPICGTKNSDVNHPWQVAIYERRRNKDKVLICAGSLINQRVIVTAARCVTKSSGRSVKAKNKFEVAVGKFYRKYSDIRDSSAQFSTVQEIFIPQSYEGESNSFVGDIAVLVTHKLLQLTQSVRPVCMNWALKNFIQQLSGPTYMNRWSPEPETGLASDSVKELKILTDFNSPDCDTVDKICSRTTSVCAGDIGGGLVFKNPEDGRFYLIATLSVSSRFLPQEDETCRRQKFGLYTDVTKYIPNFIVNKALTYEDFDKENFFKCSSGESIVKDQECDGLVNCEDASDEHDNCKEINCPANYVRCNYGACIHEDNKCDGKQDCNDNSDEDYNSCNRRKGEFCGGSKRVTSSTPVPAAASEETATENVDQECTLPQFPENGFWNITTDLAAYKPGNSAPPETILQTTCNDKYKFMGQPFTVCKQGAWKPSLAGKCLATCPDIPSRQSKTYVSCTFNGEKIEDCAEPVHGTVAEFTCADYYEISHRYKSQNLSCVDGAWDNEFPSCRPVCGLKKSGDVSSDYPWQVGIYQNASSIVIFACVGTIITERNVLTSGGCVTDFFGRFYLATTYVIAGKSHSKSYYDPLDSSDRQFRILKNIMTPDKFDGEKAFYARNIAILVTEASFTFSEKVQPICVDWLLENQQDFSKIKTGYVTAYNNLKKGEVKPFIKEMQVVYVEESKCRSNLSEYEAQFFTFDKFCAADAANKGICEKDDGGPLIYKNETDNRFYLGGVTSVYWWDFDCIPGPIAFYTNISLFMPDFIYPKVKQYLDYV